MARDDIVIEQSNRPATALLFANIGGSSLCTIDVGGWFGRDLSAQGEPAMVAFAVEWLTKAVRQRCRKAGEEIQRDALERRALRAGRDVGRPRRAAQASRKILTEPIGCMFLAGEAAHETLWGTVDGAWESGERAAEAALRRIGALEASCPRPAPAADEAATSCAGELMRPKALISWSSGKDSAFALHESGVPANSTWSAR